MNQEHLALVEFAMRRVIEARPRPSSVTQTQAAVPYRKSEGLGT